jgi:CheY-like chemotaxis protein
MPPDPNSPPIHSRLCILGEGDPFLARLLQRFAEKCGFRVRQALTGEDVLAGSQLEPPRLILLDPELPGKIRGWEAVHELRANPQTRPIPVILCSWLLEADVRELVGEELPYLQKPDLHFEEFSAALDRAGISPGFWSDRPEN